MSVPVMWHQTPWGGIETHAGLPETLRRADDLLGDHSILDDLLVVVDVVQEQVERSNPLPKSAFDPIPFLPCDEAGHKVEREDTFLAALVAVDVERNAQVHQVPLSGFVVAQEVTFGERVDPVHQAAELRARRAVGEEKLVVKAAGVVGPEPHCTVSVVGAPHRPAESRRSQPAPNESLRRWGRRVTVPVNLRLTQGRSQFEPICFLRSTNPQGVVCSRNVHSRMGTGDFGRLSS